MSSTIEIIYILVTVKISSEAGIPKGARNLQLSCVDSEYLTPCPTQGVVWIKFTTDEGEELYRMFQFKYVKQYGFNMWNGSNPSLPNAREPHYFDRPEMDAYIKRHTPVGVLKSKYVPKGKYVEAMKTFYSYMDVKGNSDLPICELWSYIVETANQQGKFSLEQLHALLLGQAGVNPLYRLPGSAFSHAILERCDVPRKSMTPDTAWLALFMKVYPGIVDDNEANIPWTNNYTGPKP